LGGAGELFVGIVGLHEYAQLKRVTHAEIYYPWNDKEAERAVIIYTITPI
jgi:hypothetical protein